MIFKPPKISRLILMFCALFWHHAAHSDIINNSSFTVYYTFEDSNHIAIIKPGKSYIGAQDFLAIPELKNNFIFKTVDLVDVVIDEQGEVKTQINNPISWLVQFFTGGWMALPKHHPLTQVFLSE